MCAAAASIASSPSQIRETHHRRSLPSNRLSTHETILSDFQDLVDITRSVSSQSLKQIKEQVLIAVEPAIASLDASLDLAFTDPPALYGSLSAAYASLKAACRIVESRIDRVQPEIETIFKIISQRNVQSLVDYPTVRDVSKKPFRPDMDDDLCREFSTAMRLQEADATPRSLQDDLDLDSLCHRLKPIHFREDLHKLCYFAQEFFNVLKLIARYSFMASSVLHSLELIKINEPTRVVLPIDIATLIKAIFVGRIKKIEDIASTSLGVVMLVEIAQKPYALKFLKKEQTSDAFARREFITTMDFTTNSHPSILRSFGCIDVSFFFKEEIADQYMPFGILMPYYIEGTLFSRNKGRIPTRSEAKRLLLSIACAIREFHRRRLVHADIKPDNVLLDNAHPILCDFGFCHKDTEFIQCGSSRYASPEVFLSMQSCELQTPKDVWSFGVLAYEYISRTMFIPIETEISVDRLVKDFWAKWLRLSEKEAFKGINQFIAEALTEASTEVEGFDEFWDIIQKCLQYPPQRRASMDEIIHDLESLS